MLKFVCVYCCSPFAPTSNRPQMRCPDCRRRSIKPGSPPCVDCGSRISFSMKDEPRCHPCRRKRNGDVATQIVARPTDVPYRKRTTTARGYGNAHQQARRAYLAKFQVGDPCARCGEPMLDVGKIHLDHTDDRLGYLGLSHDTCNTSAGAQKRNYRRSVRLRDRVCDGCGLTFHPRQQTQWHCSRACVGARRKAA